MSHISLGWHFYVLHTSRLALLCWPIMRAPHKNSGTLLEVRQRWFKLTEICFGQILHVPVFNVNIWWKGKQFYLIAHRRFGNVYKGFFQGGSIAGSGWGSLYWGCKIVLNWAKWLDTTFRLFSAKFFHCLTTSGVRYLWEWCVVNCCEKGWELLEIELCP